MSNAVRSLHLIIREMLDEGILDGVSDGTVPRAIPSDTRAAARARDLENAKKIGDAASKRLAPAISKAKSEVSKMSTADVKNLVKNFGKDSKSFTRDDANKASAAVLNLTKRDAQGSREMLATMKTNPKLRAAVLSTPGMSDMQTAADTNLRADGKDPRTAVGDEWRKLGNLASKYNLSEAAIIRIIREEIEDMLIGG